MESSPSFSQATHTTASETLSLAYLLERGIDCTRRGSHVEGVAFFVLARERLTPDQLHLAIVLDAFLQSHAHYWQAQESLHFASKHFAAATSEHQDCLVALEKLLPSLADTLEQGSQSHIQPQHNQFPTRHLSQPPTRLQVLPTDHAHASDPSHASHANFTLVGSSRSSTQEHLHTADDALPDLYITCFGHFEVKQFNQPVMLCHSRSGQAVLRYLVAQVGYRASVDRLMDIVWPHDAPDIARRKLQVAVSAARRSLNEGCSGGRVGHEGPGEGYILCKDGFYQLNPSVRIQTDVEEFLLLWQAGRQANGSESMALYEKACSLCSGPFLVEDTYADWSSTRREQLKQIYFTMCRALADYAVETRQYEDAVKWTSAILREDRCDEMAHRQLIRTYIAQGWRSEALQHYYRCERILSQELGVQPMAETMDLLHVILNSLDLPPRENIPSE